MAERAGAMSIAANAPAKTADESYRELMEQVKKRTDAARFFLRMRRMYPQVIAESVALQIRNILETVVLGSLVADLPEYERQKANIRKKQRISVLMRTMESVNQDYYPVPTRQVLDKLGRVVETVPVESGFLTKDQCASLYGKCSQLLHVLGPMSDSMSFLEEAPKWLDKIITLLNHHQIQLSDPDTQLWTLMHASSDGQVHVYTFERIREKDVRFLPRDAREGLERLKRYRDAGAQARPA